MGFGVSACAVCDGFFYKGQEVVVVGAGDTAAEEATYLAKLCPKVTMLVRRDQMRASKAMQNRVLATENIEVLWNTETVDLLGDDKGLTAVKAKNNQTGEEMKFLLLAFSLLLATNQIRTSSKVRLIWTIQATSSPNQIQQLLISPESFVVEMHRIKSTVKQ